MKAFSELVQRFHDWTLAVNYDSNIVNNSQYIWEIPESALETWKHELDDYEERFTEHTLSLYREMFQVGKSLVGILIGCNSEDEFVRLHKLSMNVASWHFNKLLCSGDINILSQNGITNMVTLASGRQVTLPIVLNAQTLKSDNDFDLIDSRFNDFGLCMGEDFELRKRSHNRLEQESWLATINYSTGSFHLVRSHTGNEKKFEEYYQKLKAAAANSSGQGGSNQGSSSISGNIVPYDYAYPSGTIKYLSGPSEIMFEWSIMDEEKEIETIDTIVNNIQDSINSGALSSPELLTADDMQYLYESLLEKIKKDNEENVVEENKGENNL